MKTEFLGPDHGQMSLFGVAAVPASRAKLTKKRIQNLAKSLLVADARCGTCGIPRCSAYYGTAANGRTCRMRCAVLDGWLDVNTGEPAVEPVEHDGFPPGTVGLAAYFVRSSNTVVIRCDRHRPKNGKKVEVPLW